MSQTRSSNTYQKIDTIFKRDANNIIMPYAGFVYPELEWLRNCKFEATEKIDGTNIRIEMRRVINSDNTITFDVEYKGKTDNANMPKHLETFLKETYPIEKVVASFGFPMTITPDTDETGELWEKVMNGPELYTLYGEGYGVKIQAGGNYIKNGVGFIMFDVKIGDMYLLRDSVVDIASKLGAPVVPYIGEFTIDEAIEYVRKGFKSTIAENKDYDAEGLVLKAPLGLRTRRGDRIVFKIKTCDFIKYRNKYGTDSPVEQPENLLYNK